MNNARKRRAPTLDTLRQLLLKSGNLCAYSGCDALMMTEDGTFIGQICHIEAAAPGGERFNPHMTDEDRCTASNLMLMCYAHHVATDDVAKFPVERLKSMKAAHEHRFAGSDRAMREKIARLNWKALVAGGFITGAGLTGLMKQFRDMLDVLIKPLHKSDADAKPLRTELLQILRYASRGTVHYYSCDPLHLAVTEVFIELFQESGWYIDRLADPLHLQEEREIDYENAALLLFTVRDRNQLPIVKAAIAEFFSMAGFRIAPNDDVTMDAADGKPIRFYVPIGVKAPR